MESGCHMWRVRKVLGWIFAIECFFFAFVVWIVHYPPQHGQPFIDGGDASPLLTTIEFCAFYFVVISVPGIAWWTIWKERASSRIWGVAASITSLFLYLQPDYWYKINQRGVWVHWAICLLGLIAFLAPQSERPEGDTSRDLREEELPNATWCYAWGVLFPLVYLLTKRRSQQNAFLRFHCIQCLILFSLGALCFFFDKGWRGDISAIAFLAVVISYFVAAFKAGQRKRFRLPLISALAERFT